MTAALISRMRSRSSSKAFGQSRAIGNSAAARHAAGSRDGFRRDDAAVEGAESQPGHCLRLDGERYETGAILLDLAVLAGNLACEAHWRHLLPHLGAAAQEYVGIASRQLPQDRQIGAGALRQVEQLGESTAVHQ